MYKQTYKDLKGFRDKILYVLSLLKKGSTDEIATQVAEFDGVSSEEEMADITNEVGYELKKLVEEGLAFELKEHGEKRRFELTKV